MALFTQSQFFFGITVDEGNRAIDFNEGGPDITALMDVGDYTFAQLGNEFARAMNAAGGQLYSVTPDRTNRWYNISGAGTFELLFDTGVSGSESGNLLGFGENNYTGASSYNGVQGVGKNYRPQFLLQRYVPFVNSRSFVAGRVNESASGAIETVSFGRRQFMECNIKYITNINQGSGSPIETNLTGLEDALDFMNEIIRKVELEFMEDRDDPNTFDTCVLESTTADRDGIAFTLRELFGNNLAEYYETGKLTFRKIL